jgi:hypothetical protein
MMVINDTMNTPSCHPWISMSSLVLFLAYKIKFTLIRPGPLIRALATDFPSNVVNAYRATA